MILLFLLCIVPIGSIAKQKEIVLNKMDSQLLLLAHTSDMSRRLTDKTLERSRHMCLIGIASQIGCIQERLSLF